MFVEAIDAEGGDLRSALWLCVPDSSECPAEWCWEFRIGSTIIDDGLTIEGAHVYRST
jgi:hypothetical protein